MSDLAVEHGIVEKSGTWIIYKGEKICQGREQAKKYLKENPKVADELEKLIREKLLPKKSNQPNASEEKHTSAKKHK